MRFSYPKQMRGLHILATTYVYIAFLHRPATGHNESYVFSVYYDAVSKLPFPPSLRPDGVQDPLIKKNKPPRRIGYRSNGCTCQDLVCGCCMGMNFQQFNFQREACLNFTYDPTDFSLSMGMLMNNNVLFTNSISAKNPPPLCIPVPIPYLPSVDFCAKLFDVYTPGQNLHMCLDFETRIQRAPVLVLHFNCMRMGTSGLAILKPGDPVLPPSPTETVTDIDTYDEVTEIKYKKDLIE